MKNIIIIDLLTQSFQVIDNHLQSMEHLQNALIILHLEACQLVLEDILFALLTASMPSCLLQSLPYLTSSITIFDFAQTPLNQWHCKW
jgi:hypothetical protein